MPRRHSTSLLPDGLPFDEPVSEDVPFNNDKFNNDKKKAVWVLIFGLVIVTIFGIKSSSIANFLIKTFGLKDSSGSSADDDYAYDWASDNECPVNTPIFQMDETIDVPNGFNAFYLTIYLIGTGILIGFLLWYFPPTTVYHLVKEKITPKGLIHLLDDADDIENGYEDYSSDDDIKCLFEDFSDDSNDDDDDNEFGHCRSSRNLNPRRQIDDYDHEAQPYSPRTSLSRAKHGRPRSTQDIKILPY